MDVSGACDTGFMWIVMDHMGVEELLYILNIQIG